jgi:hypothetical protein
MTKSLRRGIPSYNQLKSLAQFRDKTDEEFDLIYATKIATMAEDAEYESRIKTKLDDFEKDYEISDLKINDQMTLRSMMQSIITVEELNKMAYDLRVDGISQDNVLVVEKINRMITEQLTAISKMQDDLKITRKYRKGQENESVLAFIDVLKKKAKEFYDKKMFIVTCPKCKKWIFSGWFLFPDSKNKIVLTCTSVTDDGGKCGEVITITSKELLERRGFSEASLFPETLT